MERFVIDPKKIPHVKFDRRWPLSTGGRETIYKAGGWSMSEYDDSNLQEVEKTIYSWIAWYEFLKNREQ